MAALPSDYKRVTTSVDKTEILYAINKANVTKKALKDADLEAFQANVDENLKKRPCYPACCREGLCFSRRSREVQRHAVEGA